MWEGTHEKNRKWVNLRKGHSRRRVIGGQISAHFAAGSVLGGIVRSPGPSARVVRMSTALASPPSVFYFSSFFLYFLKY